MTQLEKHRTAISAELDQGWEILKGQAAGIDRIVNDGPNSPADNELVKGVFLVVRGELWMRLNASKD